MGSSNNLSSLLLRLLSSEGKVKVSLGGHVICGGGNFRNEDGNDDEYKVGDKDVNWDKVLWKINRMDNATFIDVCYHQEGKP